jgi:HEAT repeat protein
MNGSASASKGDALPLGETLMHIRRTGGLGVVFATLGLLVSLASWAQQKSEGKPSVSQLLAELHSGQWSDRAQAYEALRSDLQDLGSQQVQEGLLELLDRENQVIESTNRDPQGPSVEEKYGEGYAEYVGELGDTVDTFANWNDPRQVCIFVHESYDPESRFAAKIALHGAIAIPCLIQMYGSDVGLIRAEAAPVIVQAWAKTNNLDESTLQKAKEIARMSLHDQSEAVRINTVKALGKFGGEDMIPALRQVAATDPAPEVHGHSIRKRAAEAIAEIQKRAGQQKN